MTPEEKKEALTPVLQDWIYGMMEATEGKVKAWDVVNEAISGEDKDGDGFYDLQSATRVQLLQMMPRTISTGRITWVTLSMFALL